jgi:hypothetical protein
MNNGNRQIDKEKWKEFKVNSSRLLLADYFEESFSSHFWNQA